MNYTIIGFISASDNDVGAVRNYFAADLSLGGYYCDCCVGNGFTNLPLLVDLSDLMGAPLLIFPFFRLGVYSDFCYL